MLAEGDHFRYCTSLIAEAAHTSAQLVIEVDDSKSARIWHCQSFQRLVEELLLTDCQSQGSGLGSVLVRPVRAMFFTSSFVSQFKALLYKKTRLLDFFLTQQIAKLQEVLLGLQTQAKQASALAVP